MADCIASNYLMDTNKDILGVIVVSYFQNTLRVSSGQDTV